MRQTCLNMVYGLAKRDERVVFVGSDLSPGLLADMKRLNDLPCSLQHRMKKARR